MRQLTEYTPMKGKALATICWLDGEVSFARWESGRCVKARCRPADSCDADGYLEELSQLAPGGRLSRLRVRWIVLQEAYPFHLPESGEVGIRDLKVPSWMRACWEHLPARYLPKVIYSGLTLMEERLLDWTGFSIEGTGFMLSIGGRSLLMGHGNGRAFRRVSRQGLAGSLEGGRFGLEWLLQTRTLFRNRTGMELKEVAYPGELPFAVQPGSDFPITIRESAAPPGWQPDPDLLGEPGLAYLHSCASGQRLPARAAFAMPSLARRRRLHKWEARLRLGTGILMAGWGFMLLGACRHEALVPDFKHMHSRNLEDYKGSLVNKQSAYAIGKSREVRRAASFNLVSSLAESAPAGIQVRRFVIERDSPQGGPGLGLSLEGVVSGPDGPAQFQHWISKLREEASITNVENLRFSRENGALAFFLDGRSANPGAAR